MSSENSPTGTPILIAYDGSADARAAIDHVARLLPGAADTGLAAEPRVSSTMATASEAIVAAAEDLDASLIVIGS